MLRSNILSELVRSSCGSANPIASVLSSVGSQPASNGMESSMRPAPEGLFESVSNQAMGEDRLVWGSQAEVESRAQEQATLVQQFLNPSLNDGIERAGSESVLDLPQSAQGQGSAWAEEFLAQRSPVNQARAQPQVQDENEDDFYVVESSECVLPPAKHALKKLIAAQSFEQEIENDMAVTLEYLNRAASSDNLLEIAGIVVYKRAMSIIGASDMQVIGKGMTKAASENLIPISSYLAHGARVLIEIPKGEENDKLFNWLTSGNPKVNGASDCKKQADAVAEGKYIYNRYAATHGVDIDKKGSVFETKGFAIGAQSYVCSRGSEVASVALGAMGLKPLVDQYHDFDNSAKTNHYGIDLTLGVDQHGQDRLGNFIEGVGLNQGHFYIYYLKPTADAPGAILFGVEGSSPDSPEHSKLGKSDLYSPSYGSLWEYLDNKKDGDYSNCVIGKKIHGRKITLTKEALDSIVEIDVNKIDNAKLVASIPSDSVKSFLAQNMQDVSDDNDGGSGNDHPAVNVDNDIFSASSAQPQSAEDSDGSSKVSQSQLVVSGNNDNTVMPNSSGGDGGHGSGSNNDHGNGGDTSRDNELVLNQPSSNKVTDSNDNPSLGAIFVATMILFIAYITLITSLTKGIDYSCDDSSHDDEDNNELDVLGVPTHVLVDPV